MWVSAGILWVLGVWVVWAAVQTPIMVRPRSKELVDRWAAKQPLRGLRRAMRWWDDYHYGVVRHPDGSIGPAVEYTWTHLGRDLRRVLARLVSLARRPRSSLAARPRSPRRSLSITRCRCQSPPRSSR